MSPRPCSGRSRPRDLRRQHRRRGPPDRLAEIFTDGVTSRGPDRGLGLPVVPPAGAGPGPVRRHLPDRPGLSVASELSCDVMIVTTGASSATVRGVAAGAVNFIVKPFAPTCSRRAWAPTRSTARSCPRRRRPQPAGRRPGARRPPPGRPAADPQGGQSPVTARLVVDRLRKADQPATAAEVATDLASHEPPPSATSPRWPRRDAPTWPCGTETPGGLSIGTAGRLRRHRPTPGAARDRRDGSKAVPLP